MTESDNNQKEKEEDVAGFEVFKSQVNTQNPVWFEGKIVKIFFLCVFTIGGTILLLWIAGSIMPNTDTVITGFALFFTSPWFHISFIFITWLICTISFMREESLVLRLIFLTLILILYVISHSLVTS